MYVGPWQEYRAIERARVAEQYQALHSSRQRGSDDVAEELERLRRAIDVVSSELDPAAARKVREALAVVHEEASPPRARGRERVIPSVSASAHQFKLDVSRVSPLRSGALRTLESSFKFGSDAHEHSSGRPPSSARSVLSCCSSARSQPQQQQTRGARVPADSKARSMRTLEATAGRSSARSNRSTPRSSRSTVSAPEMRSLELARLDQPNANSKPAYDSRGAARLLKAERETKLRAQFWGWKADGSSSQAAKQSSGKKAAAKSPAQVSQVSRMRKAYIAGCARADGDAAQPATEPRGENRVEARNSIPLTPLEFASRTAAPPPPQPLDRPVEHFALTAAQLSSVAKYFGGTALELAPESPRQAPPESARARESAASAAAAAAALRPAASEPDLFEHVPSLRSTNLPTQRTNPSPRMDVDDLLNWAESLDHDLCGDE